MKKIMRDNIRKNILFLVCKNKYLINVEIKISIFFHLSFVCINVCIYPESKNELTYLKLSKRIVRVGQFDDEILQFCREVDLGGVDRKSLHLVSAGGYVCGGGC